MREIKFRAKIKGHIGFVFGVPCNVYEDKDFQNKWFDSIQYCEGGEFLKEYIEENTLGQFTGIKDYSENEIFEGDILSPISSEGYPYLVQFDEGEFCLYSKFGRWGSISKMRPTCDKLNIKINVIGNIYENPELWQGAS